MSDRDDIWHGDSISIGHCQNEKCRCMNVVVVVSDGDEPLADLILDVDGAEAMANDILAAVKYLRARRKRLDAAGVGQTKH